MVGTTEHCSCDPDRKDVGPGRAHESNHLRPVDHVQSPRRVAREGLEKRILRHEHRKPAGSN